MGLKLNFIKNRKFIVQLWVIFFCISCFSLSATLSPISDKSDIMNVVIWDMCVFVPLIILSCLLLKGISFKFCSLKEFFIRNRGIILLLLFSAVIRLYQFDLFPRWDTDVYLDSLIDACSKFDFTVGSYFNSFRLCSHSSLGYALFLATGYYCSPNNLIGINIVNLILLECAVVFIYQMLCRIFPGISKKIILLGVLLVSVEPMFLGIFYNLSLDFGIAVFLIFIMYFNKINYNILFFFFSLILVQTKEVGVVILAGYFIGYAIICFISNEGKVINRILDLATEPALIGAFFGGISMIYYKIWMNLSQDLNMWGGDISVGNSANVTNNYFGLDFSYILLKIKTIFFINFYWIPAIIILVGLIYFFVYHVQIKKFFCQNKELFASVFGMVFLMGFNMLYITYNNPRYNMVIQVLLVFYMVIVFLRLVIKENIRLAVMSVITILFLIQSYTTIDPVSFLLFPNLNTSDKMKIVHTGWDEQISLVADISLYNNQTAYLDKCFDSILRKENYDSNKDILLWGTYDSDTKFEGMRSAFFEGKGLKFNWDAEFGKRTYVKSASSTDLNIINEIEFEQKYDAKDLNREAILIIIKQFYNHENEVLSEVEKYYEIGNRKKCEVFGQGTIYYYNLKLKQ